jgi:hypothetical protein
MNIWGIRRGTRGDKCQIVNLPPRVTEPGEVQRRLATTKEFLTFNRSLWFLVAILLTGYLVRENSLVQLV